MLEEVRDHIFLQGIDGYSPHALEKSVASMSKNCTFSNSQSNLHKKSYLARTMASKYPCDIRCTCIDEHPIKKKNYAFIKCTAKATKYVGDGCVEAKKTWHL